MPEFTPPSKPSSMSFAGDEYFANLTLNVAQITDTLHLGRDEAGILDKKLDPELQSIVSKIIELLHTAEYQHEAERELAAITDPNVAVAILRQSFRVQSEQVNDLLVDKLTSLCRSENSQTAREAVQEATGSELERLSRLADEVFLNVGTEAELAQIAADWQRSLDVRIRACRRLIEHHRSIDAALIALDLFVEGANIPGSHELLRQLGNSFGVLETVDEAVVREKVIEPLLEKIQQFERDTDVRRFLLQVVGNLHGAVLTHLRQISPFDIGGNDMWLALTLRQCAFQEPSATQYMITLMTDDRVNDRFQLRLSRRIKDKRIKFTPDMVEDLMFALNELPYSYKDEMQQNIQEAIGLAEGKSVTRKPKEIYDEIIAKYSTRGDIDEDDQVLWEFRHTRGALNFLHAQLKNIADDDLVVALKIIGHERYKGYWNEQLQILLDVYPRLTPVLKQKAIPLIYEVAVNQPKRSKTWRRANEFLANLVDGGRDDSELARRYWKKLGDP